MARLFFLRHGKAEDVSPLGEDRHRKLVGRGERNANEIGQLINKVMKKPDLILVSPAERTQQTAAIVKQHLGDVELVTENRIYNADGETLLDVITDYGFEQKCIMVVGHNPGLIILMHILLAEDGNRAQKSISDFPTASLAEMVFEDDMIADIKRSSGTLVSLKRPREGY